MLTYNIKPIKAVPLLILPLGLFEITVIIFTLIITKQLMNILVSQSHNCLSTHSFPRIKTTLFLMIRSGIYFLKMVYPLLIVVTCIEPFILPMLAK